MMLTKKSLFAILLFGTMVTHAVDQKSTEFFLEGKPGTKYFLEYKNEKNWIVEKGLNQSKKLKDWVEEFGNDEDFYDKDENELTIPLDSILKYTTLADGTPYLNVVNNDDIKNFVELSEKTLSVNNLNTQQLITQINLANFLDNKTILKEAAQSLGKSINKKEELLKFLEGKGLIWKIIKQVPDDVLEHFLKEQLPKVTLETTITKPQRPDHDRPIIITWLPDGKIAIEIIRGQARDLKIWNPKTGKLEDLIPHHYSPFGIIWWSPNKKRLAFKSDERGLRIWNLETNQFEETIPNYQVFPNYGISRLWWSPDGKQFTTSSHDDAISVWKLEEDNVFVQSATKIDPTPMHNYLPEMSPDRQNLAFISNEGFGIWNFQTNTFSNLFFNYDAETFYRAWWSPDSNRLAFISNKGFNIWNFQIKRLEKKLPDDIGIIYNVWWSPDGTKLAFTSQNKRFSIWNFNTNKLETKVASYIQPNLFSLNNWSPDGTRLAYQLQKEKFIWNFQNNKSERISFSLPQIQSYQSGGLELFRWSPDGKKLAFQTENGIDIWNAQTKNIFEIFHSTPVKSLKWSPDGKKIAAAFIDGLVQLFDLDASANLSFEQTITMYALQTHYDKYQKPFDITKNKEIFLIMLTFPLEKLWSMQQLRLIFLPKQFLIEVGNSVNDDLNKLEMLEKSKAYKLVEDIKTQIEFIISSFGETPTAKKLKKKLDDTIYKKFTQELEKKLIRLSYKTEPPTEKSLDSIHKESKLLDNIQPIPELLGKIHLLYTWKRTDTMLEQLKKIKDNRTKELRVKEIEGNIFHIKSLGNKDIAKKLEKKLEIILIEKKKK